MQKFSLIVNSLILVTSFNVIKCENQILNKTRTTVPFNTSICGIMSESHSLVQGGKISAATHFPWLAAVFMNNNGEIIHTGSGSLISHNHIIIRARSVSILDSSNFLVPVNVSTLQIHLGSIQYFQSQDNESVKVGVEKIVNHPFAKKVSNTLYVNAISMIFTNREIEFTEKIKPVCLWPFMMEHENLAGKSAYIASHGFGSKRKSENLIRKHTHVTIQESCNDYFEDELKFSNETNLFCVKGDSNGSACIGDNQLFMKMNENWFLKGFISSVYKYDDGKCNSEALTLCEDIQQNIILIKVLML
ncbi:hypothetical protein PVAND_001904 [Polypedilum vanderplanki]|uniref:Peptidase S1 domain-containing protein n=1 Tax=Polypedilum vanderplanki TaxID=319348 RepID=A0A9J6BPD9_POLVA|nr:hypothetical protein PVAND_001904 [Polypedilum vanderplanki]